ncbi:MAG: DUF3747 domain-containing protein [Cyanobacteria bacterium P01_F01_bin.86]
MKSKTVLKFTALAAATIGFFGTTGRAWAQFTAQEVDQSDFLAAAEQTSSRFLPYQLYLIRQISDARPCYQVNGSSPGEVTPLWTTFDFSGICGRSSDSNGYSIRVDSEDLGAAYKLNIQESGEELVLIGRGSAGTMVIGRTGGISSTGFTEIELEPGWRITQRVFQGGTLGHYYFTNDATLAELTSDEPVVVNPPTTTPPLDTSEPAPFPDVVGDIYVTEIARAVEIGFVSGFQDGTFKPLRPVTREEAVSMVVEALRAQLPDGTQLPVVQLTSAPYPDVPTDRWSAEKIALLKDIGIVSGDQFGNFRPSDTITRAELMAMMRRTAESYRNYLGLDPTLEPTEDLFTFSDTNGHWAEDVISRMSGYCGVATPFNEQGTAFQPNSESLRNYTAAAIERLFDCGTTPEG